MYYIFKVGLSAIVIVIISEVGKRSSIFGALIASLPLTSLLAIIWMWSEKTEISRIAELSSSIFWLVIPSLLFFIIFPLLINKGIHFWLSFIVAVSCTVGAYLIIIKILNIFDIKL